MVINHPLSASSIYYDPWHLLCSVYMPDSLFPQSLSKFYSVSLLAWNPPLHTFLHTVIFAAHAHTIATWHCTDILALQQFYFSRFELLSLYWSVGLLFDVAKEDVQGEGEVCDTHFPCNYELKYLFHICTVQLLLSRAVYQLKMVSHLITQLLLLPFYCPLSGTTRVSQYQKKHSPTHTYPDHQSSFICFLHLLWSIASSLFNLRAWQSFCTTSFQVLWSTS